MKKLVIVLTLVVISASSGAENCFKIDFDFDLPATLSGRITDAAQFSARLKHTEGRAADGPYLALDTPLSVDVGLGCTNWSAIPVLTERQKQLANWRNRHVTISGRLNRFASGLVYPPIFIDLKSITGN